VRRIQLLSPHVAQQIAAGEVISRPASVVKELFENSLDAGSSQIVLDIHQGGLSRIYLRDNGHGIHPDDLPLAPSRHATSKVYQEQDLESIATYGFRGEALYSIAGVSRMQLSSRVAEEQHGWFLQSDPREPISCKPIAHTIGTTIEVRNLFFNTPARRKFLRSEQTEWTQIEETVRRLSLCNFSTSIELHHNKRARWQLEPALDRSAQANRIATLCGANFMEEAIFIEHREQELQLWGWISHPNFSRSQTNFQYFYVNARMVRDKIIAHAVQQAYQDLLPSKRYPALILFLTLDPSQVDVNAHPSKLEIRFRNQQSIHHFIYHHLKNKLRTFTAPAPVVHPLHHHDHLPHVAEQKPLPFLTQPTTASLPPSNQSSKAENIHHIHPPLANSSPNLEAPRPLPNLEAPPLGFALAQLHGIYLLAENTHGLILVDIHAAHERIIYEQLKRALTESKIKTQILLMPIPIKLEATHIDLYQQHEEVFKNFGFDLDVLSERCLSVRAVPDLLNPAHIENLLRDLLNDLASEIESTCIVDAMHQRLASKACQYSIRANRTMTLQEMNQLLRDIEQTPASSQCNHGRPTWKQINLMQLNQMFLRGR
jgi:DNA mismatch repair protein MutL